LRPYLVRYRPPLLSVSVPSALPFSPSLSRYFSSSVPLRFPRPAATFAPGRIDTRRGGCNDRRSIRSFAIKLYHRLEWRLHFENLTTRHCYKTLPDRREMFFRLSTVFSIFKKLKTKDIDIYITRMLHFA